MKFKELSKKTVRDREIEISKYWKDIDLLHLSVEERTRQIITSFLMDHQLQMVSQEYIMLYLEL